MAWFGPRALTVLLLILLAPAVGGCGDSRQFSELMERPAVIPPERSIVALPESLAHARLAVRRHIDRDFLQERVVLANNTAVVGENAVRVRTLWRGLQPRPWIIRKFENPYTEGAIREQIKEQLPAGASLSPPQDRHNAHGAYRYVVATGDEVACVLAWQLVDARVSTTADIHPFAVDFRFCDRRRTADNLIELFDQIHLRPHL